MSEFLLPKPRLTERQEQVLLAIGRHYAAHGDYPTQRELAVAMGVKSTNAGPLIRPLVKKGYAARESGSWRNLRLTALGVSQLKELGVTLRATDVHGPGITGYG